ncbi:MAG: AEC family transporter [Methanocalculaceae archaeon]|jgi:predicted permease|nr:AEC family transporter [Methanocalculaceae archaeon]
MDFNIDTVMTSILLVVTLFLIIGVGYASRKYNILTKESVSSVSKFTLYVSLPALILYSSISKSFSYETTDILCLLLIASALYYVISIVVALVIPRLIGSKSDAIGVYRFILVFPSAIFFAYPIIQLLLGKDQIFFAAMFNLPYFLLTFSLGIWLMTSSLKKDAAEGAAAVKINPRLLLHPAFIATLVGLLLYLSSITVPQKPVIETLMYLGNMATPLALIVTGGYLFEVNFSSLFGNFRHYMIAVSRLLVLPVLVYAVLRCVLPLIAAPILVTPVLAIAVIIAGMPAAVQTVILASEYKARPETAAEIILVTTLLAAVTVPLLIATGLIPVG